TPAKTVRKSNHHHVRVLEICHDLLELLHALHERELLLHALRAVLVPLLELLLHRRQLLRQPLHTRRAATPQPTPATAPYLRNQPSPASQSEHGTNRKRKIRTCRLQRWPPAPRAAR